jgi:steroid 5-alpha reductase family enzyme
MGSLFYLFDGSSKDLNVWIGIANLVSLSGFLIELFADNSLYKSRFNKNEPDRKFIRKGVWGYTRNPNYLGEMLFWIGLSLVGFGVSAPFCLWCCWNGADVFIRFHTNERE